MALPPGVTDPLFLCELALELHMPVSEMCNRMSAHELCVVWPTFFETRRRMQKREADGQAQKRPETLG